MDLQKYTKLLFLSIFQYFLLTYELIFMPRKSIKYLWDNHSNFIISQYLFFFINIALLQLLDFITNKVVTKGLVSKGGAVFILPMVGDVNVSYFFNFISYYTGACIIVFFLICIIEKGRSYSKQIIFVIMYSSILLLLWDVIGSLLKSVIMIILCKIDFFEYDFIDYSINIYTISFLQDIEIVKEFIIGTIEINLIVEPVFIIVYLSYIFNMFKQLIDTYNIKIKNAIFCGFIYFSMFLAPSILKYQWIKSDLISIEYSLGQINSYKDFIAETIYKESEVHEWKLSCDWREFINVKKEYLDLVQNTAMCANDKYFMFKKYILLSNVDEISKQWNKDRYVVLNDILNDGIVCEDYLSYILKNNLDEDNIKILAELRVKSRNEKDVFKNKSSINIFVDNHVYKQEQFMAQISIPFKLFRLLP